MKMHLFVATTAVALMASSALAADMAPPPEPVSVGGFYVGAFGGATWFDGSGTDFSLDGGAIAPGHPDVSGNLSFDSDTGFLVGGVIGYDWADTGLRTELELSYSQANLDGFDADFDQAIPPGHPAVAGPGFDGEVAVTYVMGNLWYDFGDAMNMGGFSPYLGGGLGVGFATADLDSVGAVSIDADAKDTGFAYQLGGGLLWHIGESVTMDLGYRWKGVMLDDLEDLNSHNVMLGMNFGF